MANTHLYFHPKGDRAKLVALFEHTKSLIADTENGSFVGGNVRLVQMGVSLQHLSHVINDIAPGSPLVFCGDFNSTPNSGRRHQQPWAQ